MNIRSIKERADQLLVDCKPQLIRTIMIVSLLGLVPNLFSSTENTILSLVVRLLFLTVGHGIVVSTLKVVRNNAFALSDDDVFVGFTRIKDLFSTYFVSLIVVRLVIYALVFLLFVIFGTILGSYINLQSLLAMTSSIDIAATQLAQLLMSVPSLIFFLLIIFMIVFIASILMSAYVFFMPYLKEQYHMSAGQSLKESFSLMSGHVWEFIKLELSFLGWAIIAVFIQVIVTEVLSFMPILGTMIGSIAATIFSVYTYVPKYKLSQAIFFEELAYYRYEVQSANQGDFYNVE